MALRLVSYNIRKAIGIDGKRAPGRILDVINRLEADVVVLQEADKRLGDRPTALPLRMIEGETDLTVAPLADNDVSLGWHGNAILVRKGIDVSGTAQIDLPGLEPRGAVRVDVQSSEGALAVIGTHLALLRPWRRKQIDTILSALNQSDIGASVIAGDFNEWSETQGLERLHESHQILAPGKSFHARRPMAALDRIALGHSLHVDNAGVDQSMTARKSSDHLPVWADITPQSDSLQAPKRPGKPGEAE
ncbi:MAG: endonuclease/exonuclease/phosphatase family protein [Pseudomonadota bacterium]